MPENTVGESGEQPGGYAVARLRFALKEVSMTRTPRRSPRRLRRTPVIAVIVANLALVGWLAPSIASAQGTKEIYGFSCCAGGFGTVNYHPGESVKIEWVKKGIRTGALSRTVDLSATASGPFLTIAAAKTAITKGKTGKTVFKATTLHISDQITTTPVSLLKIPSSAAKGFYKLTFKIVKESATGGGSLIFTVLP